MWRSVGIICGIVADMWKTAESDGELLGHVESSS